MKKVCLFMVLGILFCGAVFAEKSVSYTVKSVTGKVTYQTMSGDWIDLKEGSKLSSESFINTGLNSSLVISSGDDQITIKPMKKGTVEKLVAASSTKTLVTIGSRVTASDINAAAKTGSSVSSALARASEAKSDIDWDE